MSQEAADSWIAARPEWPSAPAAVTFTTFEATPPRPPLFTTRNDEASGTIRTRGHLDRVGADLLCRTVAALRQAGHVAITVRLGPSATVDDEARTVLADLAGQLAAEGIQLTVR